MPEGLSLPGAQPPPYFQVAASGSSQALTPSPSDRETVYDITLTAACALTLGGSVAGRPQTITTILRQDATGGRVATLPSGVLWPNGSPPSLNTTVGYLDILQFMSVDGVNWIGAVLTASAASAALTISTFTSTPYAGQPLVVSGSYIGQAPTSLDYSIDGGAWVTFSGTPPSNGAFSFSIASAPAAGAHTIQVRSTTAQGEVSPAQAFTVAAPAIPSGLTLAAVRVGGSLGVAMTMGGNLNGANVTQITVYRGTSSGGESATPIATLTTGITNASSTFSATYTDTTSGLTNKTKYYYTFIATNSVGASAASVSAAAAAAEASATVSTDYLNLTGGTGSSATAPNTAGTTSPSVFVDVTVEANIAKPSSTVTLLGVGSTNSILMYVTAAGYLGFNYTDSSNGGEGTTSTALPAALFGARTFFRVMTNSSSGPVTYNNVTAAAKTINYIYSTDGMNWTVYQTNAYTGSGTLSQPTGGNVSVGGATAAGALTGQVYSAKIANAAGTVQFNPDFTVPASGTTSFQDTAATVNTITVNSPATIA